MPRPAFSPVLILLALFSLTSNTFAAPMEAKISSAEGDASYVAVKDGVERKAEPAVLLFPGDRIVTGADGRVGITFETGASILVDYNSEFIIESLDIGESGEVKAVFDLVNGRIKSFFSKLTDSDAIEYRTKAAITGIAGTPPHIIEAGELEGTPQTKVYLLGKKGDPGSLRVQGFDPGKTTVELTASQGTTVLLGLAPAVPFILGPEILKNLGSLQSSAGSSAATAASAGSIGMGTVAAAGGGAALVGVAAGSGGNSGEGGSGDSGEDTNDTGGETDSGGDFGPAQAYAGNWSYVMRHTGGSSAFGPLQTETATCVFTPESSSFVRWDCSGQPLSGAEVNSNGLVNVTYSGTLNCGWADTPLSDCTCQWTHVNRGDSSQIVIDGEQHTVSCAESYAWTYEYVYTKQ